MTIPLVERAFDHADRRALVAIDGECTYDELLAASRRVSCALLATESHRRGERIAFLIPPTIQYAVVQWGIWRAGGIAVPLCLSHPEPELEYVVEDCQPQTLVVAAELCERLAAIAQRHRIELLQAEELVGRASGPVPEVGHDWPAMILYTSGTTGGPKGVLTTHANIAAQIDSLVGAWAWSARDRILLVLPLHHVHGIINVLGCALWSGALCEMATRFDATAVWERLASGELSLFMAVPTIYARLVAAWEQASPARRRRWSVGCRGLRLMVSGSAALPVELFDRWRQITGLTLLERYGMTEIGMALSNPLSGERLAGHVGVPLPGVEIRRTDGSAVVVADDVPAELEVRGPGVFREYWGRPQETDLAFHDGWFRTGDVAVVDNGSYRLLGRQSVDIIKTGGFKVSALEIEEVLRAHPAIDECAVVGVPDQEWGERVAVGVVPAAGGDLTLETLRTWCKERVAPYKTPSRLLVLEALPRNAMGKVIKPELRKLFATP